MKSTLKANKTIHDRSCLNCLNFCVVSKNGKNATYACSSKSAKEIYKDFDQTVWQKVYGKTWVRVNVKFSYVDEHNSSLPLETALNICRSTQDNYLFWTENKTKKIRVHDDECNFIGTLKREDVAKVRSCGGNL
jgi:hypothetical protein